MQECRENFVSPSFPAGLASDPAKFQPPLFQLSDNGFLFIFKVTDPLERTQKMLGMLFSLKWKSLISV